MARKKREQIESQDITGLTYFDKLAPLLERLRDEGRRGGDANQLGNSELWVIEAD